MTRWWWLVAAVVLPRLVVFPFNENLAGDSIARTWLAHRWLERPHFIFGFDGGAKQFGPLHIYLLALAEWLYPSLLHAGRIVSLVAGSLTAWPLFVATRRWFGERAAVFSVLSFACWGVHVQCSTTSAGEALNLLLVMTAIATSSLGGGSGRGSALALTLACATRYDSWLLVPLLVAAEWQRHGFSRAFRYGLVAASAPFVMLAGDLVARGAPFFSFRYIDAFHRAWWPGEAAMWGEALYRLGCALWWPAVAVVTLTPFIALPGFVGLRRAWSERRTLRWLVLLILVPTALYTARSALFASFVPLARFTLKELLLLLPFSGWVLSEVRWRTPAIVIAAAWCLALASFSFAPDSRWSFSLRSISATSRLETALREQAQWLKDGALVVDVDPRGYDDLQLSYFSAVPFEQQHRRRYEYYWQTAPNEPPRWLVLFDGGAMERAGEVEQLDETHVRHRAATYVLRQRGRSRLYERVTPPA